MCDLWSIFFSFSKCFEQSTSWCFASHFFVARSHQFIANCHPHFLAPFLKGKAWKENFFVNFSLCTTSCSTLARHPLKFATLLLIHFVQVIPEPCGSVVLSWRHMIKTRDFQLQTTQLLEASCLFSFKSILLRTSRKCQCIKRIACMLTFIYIVQCKWYLRLKISVQGPFKHDWACSPNGCDH